MASSFWVCPNGLWCDISCMCFMSSKVLLEMLYVKFASNDMLFGVKAHWGLNKGSFRAHWVLSVFMYNVLQKMLSKCVSEWTFSALPKLVCTNSIPVQVSLIQLKLAFTLNKHSAIYVLQIVLILSLSASNHVLNYFWLSFTLKTFRKDPTTIFLRQFFSVWYLELQYEMASKHQK